MSSHEKVKSYIVACLVFAVTLVVVIGVLGYVHRWIISDRAQRLAFLAVDNGPGGQIIFAPDGSVVETTQAIGRLSGYSRSQLISGSAELSLLPPGVLDQIMSSDLQENRIIHFCPEDGLAVQHRDGRRIPISADVWRVALPIDGQLQSCVVIHLTPSESVQYLHAVGQPPMMKKEHGHDHDH